MIKIAQFKFEEIETDNHWVMYPNFGNLISKDVAYYDRIRDVPLTLVAGCPYQVSLDQSTSCTGIFIKNYTNTEAYMIELSKDKGQDADDYIFNFEVFIHQICQGAIITHLIYERPISTESYRSSQVLFQLEGIIRALCKRFDEFKSARMENIVNSSWRRVVILPEYKDWNDRKAATEFSIRNLFPWSTYYEFSIGDDRDIFESMGVMFGWFFNSFDSLGRPYVRGERYNGNIGGFVLPEVSAEEVAKELSKLGIECSWCVQNPRKSTFENLACAVEKYKVVCVELCEKHSMLALSIECGIIWLNPSKMTVVLVAANYVDKNLFKITGEEYHFVF